MWYDECEYSVSFAGGKLARGKKTGGRQRGTPNKVTADVRRLADVHSAAAIARLAHLMENAASEQAQVAAAKELLDRAHGRPRQAIEASDSSNQVFIATMLAMLEGTGRGLPSECREDERL